MSLGTLLAVGIGGFFGAIARVVVASALTGWALTVLGTRLPIGTLLVNISGSLLLGLLYGAGLRRWSPPLAGLIGAGFFGAYTTFSTFANETVALLQAGAWGQALAYALGTNALCLLAAGIGVAIGTRLSAPA